jgi:hypothetical protein
MLHKKLILLIALFYSSITVSAQYCTPFYTTGTGFGDYINGVTCNTISNLGTGGAPSPYYTDYSASFFTGLQQGQTYSITVQVGSYNSGNSVAAWIDYNQNFIFDPTEKIMQSPSGIPSFGSYTGTFTVPATALPGSTKLRVREVFVNYNIDPCNQATYGETEDYGINFAPTSSQDIAVFALNYPRVGCGAPFTDSVKVTVINTGYDSIFNFNLGYDINNTSYTGIDNITAIIAPSATYQHTFSTMGTFDSLGINDVIISATLALDTNHFNDSLASTVFLQPIINTFPWLESFDTTIYWLQSPVIGYPTASWSIANLLTTPSLGAHSGTYMARFNRASAGSRSDLISPCLDFTSLSNPIMKFFMSQYGFGSNEYLLVLASNNGGQTFTQIDSISRINSTFSSWPGGWQEFSVCLSQYAFEPNMKLRFRGNTNNNYDIGLDDILIKDMEDLNVAYANDDILCIGDTTSINVLNTLTNYRYWLVDHLGNIITPQVNGNGGTISFLLGPQLASDTFKVGIMDTLGHGFCTSFLKDAVITEVFPFPIASAGPDVTICMTDSVQLNGSGGVIYVWSPSIGLSSASIANPMASPNISVTYYLLATNPAGCNSYDTLVATVVAKPIANAGSDKTFCSGSNAILGGSPTGSGGTGTLVYSWSNAGSLSSGAATNPTTNSLVPVTYILSVTDSNNCVATDAVFVNVNIAVSTTISSTAVLCNNGNTGSATVTINSGTPAYNIAWNTSPIQTTPTITNLVPGTYYVTVIDSANCFAFDTVFIANPVPISVFTNSSNTTCGNCNGQVNAAAIGGTFPYTFAWNTSPVQNNDTINSLCNGTYFVTITDFFNCTATDSINVSGPGGSTYFGIDAGSNQFVCSGLSAMLGGAPTIVGGTFPYNYTWTPSTYLNSGFIGNPLSTPQTTITYYVTAIDGAGCMLNDSVTIYVNPASIANAGNDISYCLGGSGSIGAPSIAGLTYSWTPTAGLNNPSISNPTSNISYSLSYDLMVTNASGCTYSDSVRVTVNPLPAVSAGPDLLINPGALTNLNATPGPGSFSYAWAPANLVSSSNTQATQTNPTVSTAYSVTITDANGCTGTDEMMVYIIGTGINELDEMLNLSIYPNPFANNAFLEYELTESDKINISIFSITGLQLNEVCNQQQNPGKYKVALPCENLAAGSYLVFFKSNNGISIKKIVKQGN